MQFLVEQPAKNCIGQCVINTKIKKQGFLFSEHDVEMARTEIQNMILASRLPAVLL